LALAVTVPCKAISGSSANSLWRSYSQGGATYPPRSA